MTKANRQKIYDKFKGMCAYTGKPLDERWQVDHVCPKRHWKWHQPDCKESLNDFNNLLPTLRIINHYKRGQDLELFRDFIKRLHLRLKKLPKKTIVQRTKERIKYMNQVAEAFGVTVNKPFNGVFYFETLLQEKIK